MTVTQTSTAGTTQTAATTASDSARNKLSGSYDNFLKMLTTQLQYQDPMQPMDSAQFTNQLVMYSQVEQQISQTEKLSQLISLQKTNQTQTSLSFIGMDVEVEGKEFTLDGKPVDFSYTLDEDADNAKLRILDSSGKVVQTLKATTKSGRHELTWDGKTSEGTVAKKGEYSIDIVATVGKDKDPVSTSTSVFGRISGIETENGETKLLMGEVPVKMENVISAHKPTTAIAA
jgi:flagellar basal-body rod modification protein FlgD